MSNERSEEFYRGAVFALNRAQRDFTVTVPELQAEYVDLLAAAEAREATQPTAAEVIEAARVALGSIHKAAMDLRCATAIPSLMRAVEWHAAQETVVAELVVAEKALALCARWKEANGA